ncbi:MULTISPECIES: hypothetical protein [Citricoccus]|mgnify:CR=1 FL=1|uniref:Uncharacterized protein n=1 Tax=Citricoccus parietis TaxID=592307 RepID=A0ABV6F9F5_9MICC|nr:hypothetical protein [Citricoccus sp. K5]VXC11858.1 conserved hypothetical protein [Citricoccus sp. K5]
MSTPLSLSTSEIPTTGTYSATTERVTFWAVTGIISAAAAVGVFEVVLHLLG